MVMFPRLMKIIWKQRYATRFVLASSRRTGKTVVRIFQPAIVIEPAGMVTSLRTKDMIGRISRLSSGGVVEAINCLWPAESGTSEPGVGMCGCMSVVCGVLMWYDCAVDDCAAVSLRTLALPSELSLISRIKLSLISRSERKIMMTHTSTGGRRSSKVMPMLFAASVMATLTPL